jgi:hypothetical protein
LRGWQIRLARSFLAGREVELKDGCSASSDAVLSNYEKLHFELFEIYFFAGNVRLRFGVCRSGGIESTSIEPCTKVKKLLMLNFALPHFGNPY